MDFFQTVERRQSIRVFSGAPIEEEKLAAILDAAVNRAPSAGNVQAYQIYVAREASIRLALSQAAVGRSGRQQTWIADASAILVFCTDAERSAARYEERGRYLFAIQDATIACTYAALAAAALGLGSTFVGSFDEEAICRVIGAPEGITPITLLPIGYPAESPARRERRPMSELVREVKA